MRPEGMAKITAFFWKKLDHPGYDSCRLFELERGWRLSGAAVFRDSGRPCHFNYEVLVDSTWVTRTASVSGYLGNKAVELRIRRTKGNRWEINGLHKKAATGCLDIDLGFTPATNLIVLRRLALKIGEQAGAPAA